MADRICLSRSFVTHAFDSGYDNKLPEQATDQENSIVIQFGFILGFHNGNFRLVI
jgi:hypothetical protein